MEQDSINTSVRQFVILILFSNVSLTCVPTSSTQPRIWPISILQ